MNDRKLYNILKVEERCFKIKHGKLPTKFRVNSATYSGFCRMQSSPLPLSSVKFIIDEKLPDYNIYAG